jgi:hypothetical protein
MEHYVNNAINIVGDNEVMQKYFYKESSNDKLLFDFNLVIPIHRYETEKLTEWQDIDLCIKRWGTTRNCFNQQVYSYNNFKFQTTWGPPILIFKKLSCIHPELTFIINYFINNEDEYSGGILVFKKGHVIGKTCHEPHNQLNTNNLFKHKL